MKGHLPRLSQLHLRFWQPKRSMVGVYIDMFTIAPRLEKVTIDKDGIYNIRVIVPFHQLSSFARKNVLDQLNELNNSLPAFSNLVYLETRWKSTDSPFDPPKPCITLPRLEVLIISFRVLVHRYCPVEAFFEQLILPSIKKIVVDGDIYGAVRAISSMISRSLPCDPLTLSINGEISARPGSLTLLLHLTPQLEHLEIPLLPFDDLSNLLTASESPVVAPNLQSLHIYVLQCTTDFYSSSLIATGEMLSNAGVDFRLKSLKLIFRTTDACHSTYRILQQSLPVDELDDKVLAHIKLCKRRFLKEILDLQIETPNASEPESDARQYKALEPIESAFQHH